MRIAITGPDGAGKSAVGRALSERLRPSTLVYAGKRDFHYGSTRWALAVWRSARRLGVLPGVLAQYFVFYPLEYRENLRRFRLHPESRMTYIFDRHPIDRVIMKYELVERFRLRRVGRLRFLLEYPLRALWAGIYSRLFPRVERLYVLLPDPEVCLRRAAGHYASLEEAHIKVRAYRQAVEAYAPAHTPTTVEVDSRITVDEICARIERQIPGGRDL